MDHIQEITKEGRDHPVQMAALCPNCHAVKTRGQSRETLRTVLLEKARTAHAEWVIGNDSTPKPAK
ncbi:HNH endonuclease [Streptomyces sp. NPDC101206]|uniref:HNH endonuclease n=1 Tax=Streptomyces sp. NPDC101206 TaxID=3366128 RepID=UPI0037FC8AFA